MARQALMARAGGQREEIHHDHDDDDHDRFYIPDRDSDEYAAMQDAADAPTKARGGAIVGSFGPDLGEFGALSEAPDPRSTWKPRAELPKWFTKSRPKPF
jgi:hypothetical protein